MNWSGFQFGLNRLLMWMTLAAISVLPVRHIYLLLANSKFDDQAPALPTIAAAIFGPVTLCAAAGVLIKRERELAVVGFYVGVLLALALAITRPLV